MQADMRVDFVAKTSVYLKLLLLPGLRNSIGLCRFNDAASPFQMYTDRKLAVDKNDTIVGNPIPPAGISF